MAQRPPSAAVLILHGGHETGMEPPPPGLLNLAGLRMRPFARAVARATRREGTHEAHDSHEAGDHHEAHDEREGGDHHEAHDERGGGGRGPVLVRSVRYTHRGWNGAREDPLHDAVRALDDLTEETGGIPVVLLGHSMGARAALRAADHPSVRAVVGLAPWCPPGDPVTQLAGRDVVLLHSTRDRVTSPQATQSLTARARRAGARTCMITVRGGDHAMIRRAPVWHHLTAALVTGLLGLTSLPDPVTTALGLPLHAEATEGTLDLDRLRADRAGPAPAEPQR
ncbi:alpha/beta hydrolase [Streptomyces sp. NBC_01237]|uniref:alpha/beta hydrolase n=1 Tax=Streptomyces sp. NBC_01237 TaxID=2903790 RepID=UPI002DD8ACB8|nr:alpha/beta fold hydrolase [Streptomyces sp. NBC_01237]WRZ73556.1 alpha/beta hydrolase [Streptomyces sp. NBC_01237]